MSTTTAYSINTNIQFPPLERIDIRKLANECQEPWFNQSLCRVNDCVVRLGILKGEFHWHKHDREDELFFVLDGELLLDVRDPGERTVRLAPRQGMVVPKGIVHRTRAPSRTVVLMVEAASVVPTGD